MFLKNRITVVTINKGIVPNNQRREQLALFEEKASDFLAEFGKAVTITVEDPSLDPEDSTLTYRILEAPELTLPQ